MSEITTFKVIIGGNIFIYVIGDKIFIYIIGGGFFKAAALLKYLAGFFLLHLIFHL